MSGEPTGYCDSCGNDIDPHHPCHCHDACVCGDYRKHHKDGKGACIFNGGKFDLTHCGVDCLEFRSVSVPAKLIDWRDR